MQRRPAGKRAVLMCAFRVERQVKSLETEKADAQKALDAAIKARDAAKKVCPHSQYETCRQAGRCSRAIVVASALAHSMQMIVAWRTRHLAAYACCLCTLQRNSPSTRSANVSARVGTQAEGAGMWRPKV